MTVTLELSPELESRVHAEADKHSLPVEEYLLRLVTETLPTASEEEKRQRALELLRSVGEIGDESEQKETFQYLQTAIEEDCLSARKRFA